MVEQSILLGVLLLYLCPSGHCAAFVATDGLKPSSAVQVHIDHSPSSL
jgi:hypothetical protein